jgi:hypothetical protein
MSYKNDKKENLKKIIFWAKIKEKKVVYRERVWVNEITKKGKKKFFLELTEIKKLNLWSKCMSLKIDKMGKLKKNKIKKLYFQ